MRDSLIIQRNFEIEVIAFYRINLGLYVLQKRRDQTGEGYNQNKKLKHPKIYSTVSIM